MSKRNLTLLLLAFLAFLQGLAPLLHAHAGGPVGGVPHFHVSAGASGDMGTHLDVPVLRAHGEAIIDAAEGLSRDDGLVVFDEAVPPQSAGRPPACSSSGSPAPLRDSSRCLPCASCAPPPSRGPPLA